MKWTTVMCDSLDKAQEVIDEATKSKVVIKIDYTWDNVSEKHRFDICYVEENMWR